MDADAQHLRAAPPRAVTIGVLGVCGGAGSSVLAAAVAAASASRRLRTALVDGDRQGPGIDVLLGVEDEPGLRWPDLHSARGEVQGEHLLPLLPGWHGAHVLSADRARPQPLPADVPEDVVSALTDVCDVVVQDLAAHEVERWAPWCGIVVLVGGHDLLTVAGATALRERLTGVTAPIGLVLRGPTVGQVGAHEVARAAGLDLWAELAPDAKMSTSIEQGLGPRLRGVSHRPARNGDGRARAQVRGRRRRLLGGVADLLLDAATAP